MIDFIKYNLNEFEIDSILKKSKSFKYWNMTFKNYIWFCIEVLDKDGPMQFNIFCRKINGRLYVNIEHEEMLNYFLEY